MLRKLAILLALCGGTVLLVPPGSRALEYSEYWQDFYSPASTGIGAVPLPKGSVVHAFDPDGVECGNFITHDAGMYGFMPVYGDNPLTPADEGAVAGDAIRFVVDGRDCLAIPPAIWTGDRFQHRVDLHLEPGFIVAGTVRYDGVRPVPGMTLIMKGLSEIRTFVTENDGTFLHGPYFAAHQLALGAADPAPYRTAITAYDASLVLAHVVGKTPLSVLARRAADTNGDGIASAIDALLVLQMVIGRIDAFPGARALVSEPDSAVVSGTVGEIARADLAVRAIGDVSGNWGSALRPTTSDGTLVSSISGGTIQWRLAATEPVFALLLEVRGAGRGNAPSLPADWLAETRREGDVAIVAAAGTTPLPRDWTILAVPAGEGIAISGVANEGMAFRAAVQPATLGLAVAPNPFNPTTAVRFSLTTTSEVDLAVYDGTGRRIRALATGATAAGDHAVSWDGRDDRGRSVASGTYVVQLRAGNRVLARKVVLAR